MLNFATREKKGVKNRYETFAQHIDDFDALAHGGLPERGYYRHALSKNLGLHTYIYVNKEKQ